MRAHSQEAWQQRIETGQTISDALGGGFWGNLARDIYVQQPFGIGPMGMSKGGGNLLGTLSKHANKTVREVLKLRGGSASNLNRLQTGIGDRILSEIAEAAAKGDKSAAQAIKMLKQAGKKGQRRYGH